MDITLTCNRAKPSPLDGSEYTKVEWKDMDAVPRIGDRIKLNPQLLAAVYEVTTVVWGPSKNHVSVIADEMERHFN